MKKLIVFDVDGVLTSRRSSWLTVHRGLGKAVVKKCSKLRKVYFDSPEMTYEKWAQEDVKLWGKVSLEEIKEILNKVPLLKGAKEVCRFLKEKGYLLAIISTGINLLIERVAEELGIDYCICNEIYEKNSRLVTKINVSLDKKTKDRILKKLMRQLKIKKKDVIVIGDNNDDYSMMKLAGFSILFNPDPAKSNLAEKSADVIIKSRDLRDILQYLK